MRAPLKLSSASLFLQEHLYRNSGQANGKDTPQVNSSHKLGERAPEISANEETHGKQRSHFDVYVPGAVILPEGQSTDGEQHGCDRSPLRALLVHTVAVHQNRDEKDRSPMITKGANTGPPNNLRNERVRR